MANPFRFRIFWGEYICVGTSCRPHFGFRFRFSILAEDVGFEPTKPIKARQFSKLLISTTHPILQCVIKAEPIGFGHPRGSRFGIRLTATSLARPRRSRQNAHTSHFVNRFAFFLIHRRPKNNMRPIFHIGLICFLRSR